MKLAYQIATPDVKPAPGVTAYQGNLENSFARLHECGYDGAELMVCNPGLIDANEILSLSQKYKLEIPMVCTGEIFGQDGLFFSSLDDAIRDEAILRTKAAIDLALKLNAQINIGRLRGGYIFGESKHICRKRSVDALSEVADYAKRKGITVALEPVNSIAINFINSTQEGLALIREIDCPSFRLLLDTNHMYIDDKDMIASIFEARDYVSYVHLVDSNRLYPGNCKLDFKAFIEALKKLGYDGYLSVEVFQRPDQDTALTRSFTHIKPLI